MVCLENMFINNLNKGDNDDDDDNNNNNNSIVILLDGLTEQMQIRKLHKLHINIT